MLEAGIKQPIHHRPGIGSKRLTGTDFLEMEKIPVMNGVSLLEFTFEIMTSIYHLKNIVFWAVAGRFYFQSGPLEDHSSLGKYQGNALACRDDIALAIATPRWRSNSNTSGRAGSENILHNLQQRDNVTALDLNEPYGFKSLGGGQIDTLWL